MIQTNLALKKLQGIKPKGIKPRSNSNLEHLLDLRDEILYRTLFLHSTKQPGFYYELATPMVIRLENVDYDETDLRDFLSANLNNNLPKIASRALGNLTGALLSLLTIRNHKKNKPCYFHFDGKGNYFNNLFYCMGQHDIVVVENIKGKPFGGIATKDSPKNCMFQIAIGCDANLINIENAYSDTYFDIVNYLKNIDSVHQDKLYELVSSIHRFRGKQRFKL
ncbi:hypothetical protein HOK51_07785 [Candidatus Woesearchaeota archaeon]|jgi:hypothetical protein|nr:hypothetical protein [Candidatus Woesearchaeota archaeon]MBT6519725.1 hypothetical protein [Candidatus Woesearchaeota archaeon]MBT7368105.1 hypothetical protein [Candidatus Woesearchaeota archaeon]